jgi:CrcB protein
VFTAARIQAVAGCAQRIEKLPAIGIRLGANGGSYGENEKYHAQSHSLNILGTTKFRRIGYYGGMSKYVVVMLGGAIGAVSRFIIGSLVSRFYPATFPLGTFIINVTGSFLIGVLMTVFQNRPVLHVNWRLFLVTGILGGYTTFSSFEWEALTSIRNGTATVGFLYIGLSVTLGLAGAWLGVIVGSRLGPH